MNEPVNSLDGTISYRPVPGKPADYVLAVLFSEGVAKEITPRRLHRLQSCCHGQIHATTTPKGIAHLYMPIVANGPESACLQARDLALIFRRLFDLKLNVAVGIGVRRSGYH